MATQKVHQKLVSINGEHSAILLTFIKLPFSIKNFVLSILSGRLCFVYFKWPLKTGFTVTDIDITPCSADRTDVNCVHTFRNTVKPVLSGLSKKKKRNKFRTKASLASLRCVLEQDTLILA